MEEPGTPLIEIWGGVECTINRVRDCFSSQLVRTGHRRRLSDLDAFAALGIRTLRYPILWEELAPDAPDEIDWGPVDCQVERLRDLGIRPIAGLLHHGSGPRYTALCDPEFPVKLAAFARCVAERYPWIDAYIPVNEPLTTARFSGLYGLWYPHRRDIHTFGTALLNQCRAVVLAMREIRKVNPRAELIQTEDLGKVHSTPKLQYQAEYENARRWATWDLLCGRFTRDHPLWSHFEGAGIEPARMAIFQEEPFPPDVIGVNYYVTGERYLDENLDAHPPHTWGGNEREPYADRTAARSRPEGISGPTELFREVCRRYAQPVAITEAHLGCTRDEQLRWFRDIWDAAVRLKQEGADIRAVTAWSLLGAYDWDSLLTRQDGHYEPGVFDLRSPAPRPTALAKMISQLAAGGRFQHPALDNGGWWWRNNRRFNQEPMRQDGKAGRQSGDGTAPVHPGQTNLVVIGVETPLGRSFADAAASRSLRCVHFSSSQCSRWDLEMATRELGQARPWAVIHCTALGDVALADVAASASSRLGAQLVTFTPATIYDSPAGVQHSENDKPNAETPACRSFVETEHSVAAANPAALCIRTGTLFDTAESSDLVYVALRRLAQHESVWIDDASEFSLTFVPELVSAVLDLLIDGERGVWHMANAGAVTMPALLSTLAEARQLDLPAARHSPHPGPKDHPVRSCVLRGVRGEFLSPWQEAVHRFAMEMPRVPSRAAMAAA